MTDNPRVPTGVPGLDSVLGGGLPPHGLHLLRGAPGTGKTTLGLQFLLDGARRGEKCLFLTLSETRGQLATIAKSFGWSLDGIVTHEIRHTSDSEDSRSGYTVFSPTEVELAEISRDILTRVEEIRPARLVLDSLSEIRLLSEDAFRYRRELLALVDKISGLQCTGLLIDVEIEGSEATVAETLVSGVIELHQIAPLYGGTRRRLMVKKLRAARSVGGYHDMTMGDSGVEVYPRLVAASHRRDHSYVAMSSGIPALDALLGGGIDRGTSTVLLGPAGAGKSTIAAQFVAAAAERGDGGSVLCFDESPATLLVRTNGLKIPLETHVEANRVRLHPVNPAELTPGQMAHMVRQDVEAGARVVVIDSLNGYLNAMPDERNLAAHIHELLAYLSEQGVATLMTVAQQGFIATAESPINVTYIADTVLLFRYFEMRGEIKQALSVMKKRTGQHERTIRELALGPGVRVGSALTNLQGVLTGIPTVMPGKGGNETRGSVR